MPLETCLSYPSPTPVLSLANPAQQAGANGISEKAIWMAREQTSKKAGGEMVGTLLPLPSASVSMPIPSPADSRHVAIGRC